MPKIKDMTPDEKHIKRINQYLQSISVLYDTLLAEVCALVITQQLTDKPFKFADYPQISKQVSQSLSKYRTNLYGSIKAYTEYEWDFGNAKVKQLIEDKLNGVKSKVPLEAYNAKMREISITSQNKAAYNSFQSRKKGKFTISERVWDVAKQAKSNLELALDDSLKEGMSAQQLARKIKKDLNNPDALFRRVRDKHGNLVLSKNAKTYNPGQGVYRSAHKNALRLAANEINMAYREAEQLRIAGNPDVVGVKISLSPSHKIYDMCDELQGLYPKDFVWSGFHIQCKCFRTTVLKSDEEFINELNAGVELPPESSKNYVGKLPDNFYKWVNENSEKMSNWKRLPNFITDNEKIIKT